MTTVQTIRGTDTDNYDGNIPQSHFQRLHDEADVRFNIIGLEAQMPFARSQQQACMAAGIDNPYCYKFLYWVKNDIERMKQAAGFGKPIAIDCEIQVPNGWSTGQIVQRIHEAKDALIAEGLYWGIYTGAWWWPSATGNCTDFKDDKLWHAAYPFGNGVLPPANYLPMNFTVNYGGWTKAEVFQYADTCYLDDQGSWDLDMNAYQGPITPPVHDRVWLLGSEDAGIELVGKQQYCWNQKVLTDIRGDEAGQFPGQWLHNVGGAFIKMAD